MSIAFPSKSSFCRVDPELWSRRSSAFGRILKCVISGCDLRRGPITALRPCAIDSGKTINASAFCPPRTPFYRPLYFFYPWIQSAAAIAALFRNDGTSVMCYCFPPRLCAKIHQRPRFLSHAQQLYYSGNQRVWCLLVNFAGLDLSIKADRGVVKRVQCSFTAVIVDFQCRQVIRKWVLVISWGQVNLCCFETSHETKIFIVFHSWNMMEEAGFGIYCGECFVRKSEKFIVKHWFEKWKNFQMWEMRIFIFLSFCGFDNVNANSVKKVKNQFKKNKNKSTHFL